MRTDHIRRKYPAIARDYDLYLSCRKVDVVHVELSNGKKINHKFLQFPVGYNALPEPGGMLDQPHRLMSFFAIFQEGETMATQEILAKG